MKKYEAPQVEITPVFVNDVFTESGDGPITLPEDNFN